MTLAAADLLVAVVAFGPADLAGLDTLGVDGSGAGRLFPALGLANLHPQGIDEPLPSAVLLPGDEVIPHRALFQQIVRQHVPLATRSRLVEQGVDHLAHIHLPWPASRLGRR